MNKKTDAGLDFENTLVELEKLVVTLEEGELSLDKSLSGFKHGIELTRRCQSALDNAEQTVEELINSEDLESLKPIEPDA